MLTQGQKELVKATVPTLSESGVALTEYFYKRMLNNHPELKETFNLGHQRSGAQAKALAGAVLAYAEQIEDPSVLAPMVEQICHKHVSLNIQAPDYDIVGENLLYSISEILKIPMDDPLIDAWKAAYQQLAGLFISTEKQLYDQRAETDGSWLGWRDFIVDKKVKENEEITSFYLVPKDGESLPVYQAGQYITLRVFVPELGIKQPRQYSLSDCFSGQYLRISVKREDACAEGQDPGYVSSTLHNNVHPGDVVELSAPVGTFFLVNPEKTNVLISAGVGLTPTIAMLNQLITLNNNPDRKNNLREKIKSGSTQSAEITNDIYFVHAARGSDVHAMREEVIQLTAKHQHLHLYFAYENVQKSDVLGRDYHWLGRLNLDKIPPDYLQKNADYYLCGPILFMQQQINSLIGMGIPQENIHTEAFGTGWVSL